MLKQAPCRLYRFGNYEVDSAKRFLRLNGRKISLTPKAFDVLLALVERHGQTVSKDELLRTVWPNTVVEENGLTRNISVVRKALGEKPGERNYIVTLPGIGYRFVAAVEQADAAGETAAQRPPVRRYWFVAPVATLVVLVALLAWYYRPERASPPRTAVPLTSEPGFERNPAISPAGDQVAFTWERDSQNNFDIYVKRVKGGAPLRLTANPAEDVSPAWSPDGRTIGFVRRMSEKRSEILLIPALGGAERKVAETAGDFRIDLPSLAWSPDGRWLAVSHRDEKVDLANALYLISLQTGEKRRLATVPRGLQGDYAPAFSPDGRSLAFVRLSGYAPGAIYLLTISPDFSAAGEPRRLTPDGRLVKTPGWTADGRHIAYVFADIKPDSPRELRIIDAEGDRSAQPLSWIARAVQELSLGRHLVYTQQANDDNIWRAEICAPGIQPGVPQRLIASTWGDHYPRYSPDGKKIAFTTTRSGTWEIWTADADGLNPVKLTAVSGATPVSWSPNGQRIAFQSAADGQTDVYTIPAAGGSPVRVTNHPSDDRLPSFSHDSRWIYFSSLRSGAWEIWKMRADGGDAVQLSRSEGCYLPRESADGKSVYYCHKLPEKGIWKMSAEGGEGVQVTGPYSPPICALDVTADGIYYTAPESDKQYSIVFFDFSAGKSRSVVRSEKRLGNLAISVSPDRRHILYTQADQAGSDLMLIENFAVR